MGRITETLDYVRENRLKSMLSLCIATGVLLVLMALLPPPRAVSVTGRGGMPPLPSASLPSPVAAVQPEAARAGAGSELVPSGDAETGALNDGEDLLALDLDSLKSPTYHSGTEAIPPQENLRKLLKWIEEMERRGEVEKLAKAALQGGPLVRPLAIYALGRFSENERAANILESMALDEMCEYQYRENALHQLERCSPAAYAATLKKLMEEAVRGNGQARALVVSALFLDVTSYGGRTVRSMAPYLKERVRNAPPGRASTVWKELLSFVWRTSDADAFRMSFDEVVSSSSPILIGNYAYMLARRRRYGELKRLYDAVSSPTIKRSLAAIMEDDSLDSAGAAVGAGGS